MRDKTTESLLDDDAGDGVDGHRAGLAGVLAPRSQGVVGETQA